VKTELKEKKRRNDKLQKREVLEWVETDLSRGKEKRERRGLRNGEGKGNERKWKGKVVQERDGYGGGGDHDRGCDDYDKDE
jgi:hypothetical protein